MKHLNGNIRMAIELLIIVFALVGLLNQSSFAVPACPDCVVEVTQPDGKTIIKLKSVGDEYNGRLATEDGYTVIKNSDGWYHYASLDVNGNFISSGIAVNPINKRSSSENVFINQTEKYLNSNVFNFNEDVPDKDNIRKIISSDKGVQTTDNVLVILINYPDESNTYATSLFENLMNQADFDGSGSFNDYYTEVSYGQYGTNATVTSWYTASQNRDYYRYDNTSEATRNESFRRAAELAREAVIAASNDGIDFSIFDNDGNGHVDGVFVVHAGPGAEAGYYNYPWSHHWVLTGSGLGSVYTNGVYVNEYTMQPEKHSSSSRVRIGVFCHEYGHTLDLPDLYDTDYSSDGIGDWGLMGGGSWNGGGNYPAHFSAWSKVRLGWMEAINITSSCPTPPYQILNSEENPICYRLWTHGDASNEYFLIEYRQQTLFDTYLPGCGLAVWHIDDSKNSNANENDRWVDLEEQDNVESSGNQGDMWLNATFNGSSTPNSNSKSGNPTDISVIVQTTTCDVNGLMVDISVGFVDSDGDGICDDNDNCPGIDDNLDSDGDCIVDAEDNCPTTYNPDQLDCNTNGVGDVCEADIPCTGQTDWSRTIGGAAYDAANSIFEIADTSYNHIETNHTVTAYSTISPIITTIDEAQTIDYRLEAGSNYPNYAQISVNGVVERRLDNPDGSTFGTIVYGSFYANAGDVVVVEVNPLTQSAGKDDSQSNSAVTTYTSAHFEYITTVTEISSINFNSYIFAGTKTNDDFDFFIGSTDECGNIIDSISTGNGNDELAQGACLSSGKDVVVVGYTQSDVDKSMVVTKYSYWGVGGLTLDWTQTFNFSEDDRAFSVVEAVGGGYLVLGTTKSGTYNDLTVLKVNTNGTLAWQMTYPTATAEEAGDIIRSNVDGEYYIVGTTGGPIHTNKDVYLMKINSSGSAVWTSTLGQPGYYEIGRSLTLSNDNNIVLTGQSSEEGYSDLLLMKASRINGSLIWYKLFGEEGYENGYDIVTNGSSGFAIAGRVSLPAPSYWDCYFLMTDVNGGLISVDTIGDANDDIAFALDQTIDQGFILSGYSKTICSYDFYLNKFVPELPAAPELNYPIAGEMFYDVELPLMDWTDVTTAESYTIEIDNNSDFSSPRVTESGITVSEFTPPGPGNVDGLKETRYYWRIRGYNSTSGNGFWSASGYFDVRYAKPTLTTPSNYATIYRSGSIYFGWEALEISNSNYTIQVASDIGFNNLVINAGASCYNTYCGYPASFPYPDGMYYWRVKSNRTNFYWSNVRRFTIATVLPSCPVLYSYDGNQFNQENPLLTACEQSGYTDVVTDYYQLNSTIEPKDGKITFQLREMEDEITTLDDFELITVDHSAATNIGCTVDGQIFSYESSLSPISAIDQNGVDWIETVASTDGNFFKADEAGQLILTFENKNTETGISLGGPIKLPCYEESMPGKVDPLNVEKEPIELFKFTIEQQSSDGSWIELPTVPSRSNAAGEFVMTDGMNKLSTEDIIIRISWDYKFMTDEIRQYIPSQENPTITTWKAENYQVVAENAVAKGWGGFASSEPLVLRKDESVEFSFDVEELTDPTLSRTYIVRAVGKYEPDYSVFTNLIPNEFKLFENYPNPFNPTTTISYNLPTNTGVKLEVINVLGQTIKTLIDEKQEAGHHEVVWDGKNSQGSSVASGIYFYRIIADKFTDSKKMMLLK